MVGLVFGHQNLSSIRVLSRDTFIGPKGQPTIARRFNAGFKFGIAQVPEGRLNISVSYVSSYHHCVFSTKERRPLITAALAERLWPFLGGIARQNKMKAIEIGGVADHIHLLLSIPAAMSIAKAMQLIKGGSSKWVHETFPEHWSLGGRKSMVRSVSANRGWRRLSLTSKVSLSITRRSRFRRSS